MLKPKIWFVIVGVAFLTIIGLLGCKTEPQVFIVIFDTDGGSIVYSQPVQKNGKATKPSEDPLKTGYAFDNWYTDTTYSEVWDFETPIQKNTTLYARWIFYSYTVTFDYQDDSDPTTETIQSPTKTITNLPLPPERSGYVFIGWFTEKDDDGVEFTLSTELTSDITVYAIWDANAYPLSFDANGGTGTMKDIYLDTAEQRNLPANTFSNPGYLFAGWATSRNGSVVYLEESCFTMEPSERTLYAKWHITRSKLESMIEAGEDVSSVDTSMITDMSALFKDHLSFNQDISRWDVSNVTDMSEMFYNVIYYNKDLSTWDVSNVTNMARMFACSNSYRYFSTVNVDVSTWDVSNVTDMSEMFKNAKSFNQDISNWDVANVSQMKGIFANAASFNQDISGWDIKNITDMSSMFGGASSFNQDISNWDVCDVTNMSYMFGGAASFNQDVSSWDVSNVTDMNTMFGGATSFNQDISSWDVSNVTNMSTMFAGTNFFNQDISNWDVSNVTDMSHMFQDAFSFNQDLSSWDVSNVTNMYSMFSLSSLTQGRSSFNGDLSGWDVSNVTDMSQMFLWANAFNHNFLEI